MRNQRDVSGDFWECAEIEGRKGIAGRNEFKAAWKKGLGVRNSEVKIFEEQVGGCREVGNYELGEAHVNNSIGDNRLENPEYRLTQEMQLQMRKKSGNYRARNVGDAKWNP